MPQFHDVVTMMTSHYRLPAMRAFVTKQHPALLKVYFAACYVVLIEEVIRAVT